MANNKDFQVKNDLNVQGGKIWLNDTPSSSGNQQYATIDGSNGGDLILSSDNLVSFFESDGTTRRVVFDLNDNKYSFGDSTSGGTTDTQSEMFHVSGSGRFTSSLNVNGSILGLVSSAGSSTADSGNSHSLVNNVFLNPSPEAGGAIDIRTVNELAGLEKWGTISDVSGFYTTRTNAGSSESPNFSYSNQVTSITSGNMFDGVASTAGSWFTDNGTDGTTAGTGTFTLSFAGKKELEYTCYVGIVFGSTSFTAKKVKIEVYRGGTYANDAYSGGSWITICDLTTNSDVNVSRQVQNNAGDGVQQIRYTLGGNNTTSSTYFRVQDVYALDHDAGSNAGPKGIHYVRKYGDSDIYGNLQPATDSTYKLGSSTNFFSGIYGDKLYLNSVSSTSATDKEALFLDGTEVKKRTLGSNAFNSTSFLALTGGSLTGSVDITTSSPQLFLKSSTHTDVAQIKFSTNSNGSYAQFGTIDFSHLNDASYGSLALFEIGSSEDTTTILANGKLMYNEGIYSKPASGTGAGTRKDQNWDSAYNDKINSASFGTGDGILTLTQQDSGTVTVDLDGRFETISNVATYINRSYISNEQATDLASGWYTVAANGGNRAIARFGIWDMDSSDHQSVVFYAAHKYGTDASNTLTILDNSHFSGSPFRFIRIKDAGTYDGAVLQVYIDDNNDENNNVRVAILGDNFQTSGWVLKDWVPDANDPGTVSTSADSTGGASSSNYSSFTEKTKVDLDLIAQGGFLTTGPIYGDGDTTQYKVLTTNDEGSGNGIDADTVDGVEASSFLRSDADDTTNSKLTLNGTNPHPLEIIRTSAANSGIKFQNTQTAGEDAGQPQHTAYLGLGSADGQINIGSSQNVQGTGNRITTVADKLNAFAATTSSELAGTISDETGSGSLVFATSPTLVTPALGTPASGDLQNCTFPNTLAPKMFISSDLSIGTYKRVARVTGNQLGSMIRASFSGTTGNVVVAVVADIIVNHSGDVHIMSQAGDYHPITIKVFSDDPTVGQDSGDEDFDLYVKYEQNEGNSAGATMTLKTTILSLGDETITANPTDTAYSSGTSHEHTTTDGGVNFTQSSGNADIATDGNITATNFLGTATIAAHVTVTDNEDTDEENLITFVENAQSGTGDHGLEMDGNLTYNPSTGTLTSTKVSTTDLTATDGTFTGKVLANEFSKLNGKNVNEITVGTKIQSQNILAPRVVTDAASKIFYAALENNTRLYKNNEHIVTLSKGTAGSIAAADISLGDIIHADRPISLRQNGRPLASLAATGSFFIGRNRDDNAQSRIHFGIYSPYADGRVKYIQANTTTPTAGYVDFSDSNEYDASSNVNGWKTVALTQGAVAQLTVQATTDGSSNVEKNYYWIQSDTPVVITSCTNNSDTWTGAGADGKLLKEVTREILSYDEGNQIKYDPDNTGTITVSNSGSWRYSRSEGSLLFAHHDEGDGDGTDGTHGIPWKMCGDTYIVDHGLRGYQIATIEPSIVSSYYWNGTAWVLFKTHDLSAASRDSFAVHVEGHDNKGVDSTNFLGQADSDKPWRFIGTGRFALRTNNPSSDLGEAGNGDEEYMVLGYDSNLRSQEVIRVGKIIAEDISASAVTGDKIASNTTITVGPANDIKAGLDGTGSATDEVRIFAGAALGSKTSAPFQVKHDGALVATNATITGAVTATSGTFTGAVNASSGTFTGNVSTGAAITAGNSGIDGAGSGDDAVRIFAGNALADKATAEFRVTNAGAVNATNANITGTISASDLTMSDPSKVINITAGQIADGSVKDTSFDASGINKIQSVITDVTKLTNGDFQQRPSSAPAGSSFGGSVIESNTAEGFISNLEITDFNHGTNNPLLNLLVVISVESTEDPDTAFPGNNGTLTVGRFELFASIDGGADTKIGNTRLVQLSKANNTVSLANGNTQYNFTSLDFVDESHAIPTNNAGDNVTYKVKILTTGGSNHTDLLENAVTGSIYETAFIVTEAGGDHGGVPTLNTDGTLKITNTTLGKHSMLTLEQNQSDGDLNINNHESYIDFVFKDADSNETPQARIGAKPGVIPATGTSEAQEGHGNLMFFVNDADSESGDAGDSLKEVLTLRGENGYVGINETRPGNRLVVVDKANTNSVQNVITVRAENKESPVTVTSGSGTGIQFQVPKLLDNSGFSYGNGAQIAAVRESTDDTDISTGLTFSVSQNDGTLDEAVRIDHDMNVGIGTSSVAAGNKLEVVGKIDASGDDGTFCTDHWTLPHADGSNGQVLTTNGSGDISWATPAGFRTVSVDTNGDGSVNNTLEASETLVLKKGDNITLSEAGGVVTFGVADDITSGSFITDKAVSNDYDNDGDLDIQDLSYAFGVRGTATGMHVPQYGIGTTGLQVKATSPATNTGIISGDDGYISLHCGKPTGQTNTTHHTAALTLCGTAGEAKIFTSTTNGDVEFIHTGTSADGSGGYTYADFSTSGATFTKESSLSSEGPVITLKRQDNDADGDKLGQLLFQGHNDASTPATKDYASITTHVVDESSMAEDGKIVFDTIRNGSQVTGLEIEGRTLTVGDTIKFDTSVLTSRSSETDLNVQFVLQNIDTSNSVLVLDDRTRLSAYAFNLNDSDGIGTPTAGEGVLTYAGGDHSLFADHIFARSNSSYYIDLFTNGLAVQTAGHMRVRDDRRMGFGTSDDVKMFYDNDAISATVGELEIEMESTCQQIRMTDNTTTRFTFARSSGDFTATGNVTAYSDERLKSDIKTLDPSKTLQMRGVEFTKDGKKGSGVIAQELEKIAPELVLNEGEYKSVAYGNLSGYLIETIKDQQKQIDELKALVEKLVEKL